MADDSGQDAKQRNGEFQDFVDHCLDLYERFKKSEWRQKKLKRIEEAYRVYAQEGKETSFPWDNASNTELPLFTITVDNLEPRLVAGLTGKQPVVQFEMEGLTEQDNNTVIIENWFNEELNQTINIGEVASETVHRALLEGIVYPTASYNEDEVIRRNFVFQQQPVMDPRSGMPVIDPQTGQMQLRTEIVTDEETGEPVTEDKVDRVFQGGKVEFVAFSDVYTPDPTEMDDWEKTDWIQVVRPTYGELMQNKDRLGYMNIGPWLLAEEDEEETPDDEQSPQERVMGSKVKAHETIKCYQCCVYYVPRDEGQTDEDVENWEAQRMVGLITADSGVLIRLVPLIELNFQNESLMKRIQLYEDGSSLYDKMYSIQTGATDLFNAVINVANVTMVPWFMYTSAAGFRGEQKIEPGKGIEVDDVSQIHFPRFNQNPRSYMVFIEMFLNLWEKLGSIGDIQVGQISKGSSDVTATETMAAIQEGNIKHNYHGLALKKDFVKVIRTIYDLYYQKMPYGTVFVHRGQPVEIPRQDMQRKYKFRLTGSSDLSNKVLEMKKTESLYQNVRQDPLANGVQLLQDMIEAYKEDSPPEKYINPTITQLLQALQQAPELPQIIQQYMQQKQQQEQQGAQAQQLNMAEATGNQMAQSLVQALSGAQQQGQQQGAPQ